MAMGEARKATGMTSKIITTYPSRPAIIDGLPDALLGTWQWYLPFLSCPTFHSKAQLQATRPFCAFFGVESITCSSICVSKGKAVSYGDLLFPKDL